MQKETVAPHRQTMTGLQFTERQQKTVVMAITLVCAVVIAGAVVFGFVLLGKFADYFSGVLLPLAVAGILALILKPYYDLLVRKVRFPLLAVLLVYASVLAPLGLWAWFFGGLIVNQITELIGKVPEWIERLRGAIQERLPVLLEFWQKHNLGERLQGAVQDGGRWIANSLGSLGSGVLAAGAGIFRSIAGLLSWVVLPVYLAFFLMAKPTPPAQYESMLPFLKPGTRKDVIYLVSEFVKIVVSFFRGQVLIALAQGVLYAVGFALIGLPYGLLIGLLLGFLNIIPYLGSILGLSITVPIAFFHAEGGIGNVIAALVVIIVVQIIEGYLLTPRIMGQRTGLHPVVIIVAILFWGAALGGVFGMVLAIPLTAFLVVFWRLLKAKYIGELV